MPKKRIYEVNLLKSDFFRKKKKRKVKCLMCGLDYSTKEYDILYKAKKLMYFDVGNLNFWDAKEEEFLDSDTQVVCHGCLHKIVIKLAKNKKEKMVRCIIYDGEEQYVCNFYTDKDDGFLNGFS